jgi:hypothetical protein
MANATHDTTGRDSHTQTTPHMTAAGIPPRRPCIESNY